MIFLGYQGIGKSTWGGKHKYIDLESGNFWVDGIRSENWYIIYCKIAEHMSGQGYNVFVSSHEVVRRQLATSNQRKAIIYPSIGLKEFWINRLHERYLVTGLDKDFRAWKNAEQRYSENISELMFDTNYEHIEIKYVPYNLDDIIVDFTHSTQEDDE